MSSLGYLTSESIGRANLPRDRTTRFPLPARSGVGYPKRFVQARGRGPEVGQGGQSSTGNPASFQARIPPSIDTTFEYPIFPRLSAARAETVAEKPAFRSAFRRKRCLVPADGFYEWVRSGSKKQPYHIRMRDGAPFAFADSAPQLIPVM